MSLRSGRRACSILIAAVALLGASSTRTFDQVPYVRAQRLVDIGGRRLNLYCTGHGSPTVILDTDGHEGSIAWRYVQPSIARTTRVCSYDAAGFGFSDSAPLPRDANAFVRDLHALVLRAELSSPIVLVGYQPSGLYDRLYADRYRSAVAGMVLVDPVETYRGKRITAVAPALAPLFAAVRTFVHQCYRAALTGQMQQLASTIFKSCLITPAGPPLPHALALLNERQWQRPSTWRDYDASGIAFDDAASGEVERAQRSYGNMPLVVLTSDTSALQLPLPPIQLRALTRARQCWHDDIAKLSTIGTDIVIKGASDSIAVDDPFAVVSAIEEVVEQTRS